MSTRPRRRRSRWKPSPSCRARARSWPSRRRKSRRKRSHLRRPRHKPLSGAFLRRAVEWNLLNRAVEAEIVPAARSRGLGLVPYFPLAAGMLSGKCRRGADLPEGSRLATLGFFVDKFVSDSNFDQVEELVTFAFDHGHTVGELAIAWLAAQEGVASVIAGATDPEQIRRNVAAVEWVLTPEEVVDVPA